MQKEYGGTPPKHINLQPYTLKSRRKNAIPIINLDTGDEVKVNSGYGEAQQISNPPVGGTSALMTSSLSASTTTVYQGVSQNNVSICLVAHDYSCHLMQYTDFGSSPELILLLTLTSLLVMQFGAQCNPNTEPQKAEKPVQAVKQVSKPPAEETKTISPSEALHTMHATVTRVY